MRKYRSRAIPPFSVEAEGRCFLNQEDVREAPLTCMSAMVTHISGCLKVYSVLNGLWEEEPKKKKKKKKKKHQEDQDPEPVFHGSDSSGYQSDRTKKKKKRKSEEAELTPLVEHAT
ncbi:hypothetical protein MG293_014914 [Ovis ammon polii]|uniref:Uncharacterized protein n=1 Tax=Ovis ammon polii TaxID=230172 RepID=A0AAD4Y3W0_OVIAM|nr:hypothetical protein MG293_014914 [Ovis ammon polii]